MLKGDIHEDKAVTKWHTVHHVICLFASYFGNSVVEKLDRILSYLILSTEIENRQVFNTALLLPSGYERILHRDQT